MALGPILDKAALPYAIGGVAFQIHQTEPRTTLDIDVVVVSYAQIPREQLEAGGFTQTGRFSHSENWIGLGQTPIQFTEDPQLAPAIARSLEIVLEGVRLRVIGRIDLLHEKFRAATDPARRRSKRLQDLADAQALLESDASLQRELTEEERALLEQLPG